MASLARIRLDEALTTLNQNHHQALTVSPEREPLHLTPAWLRKEAMPPLDAGGLPTPQAQMAEDQAQRGA